jgi:hypothetical protein
VDGAHSEFRDRCIRPVDERSKKRPSNICVYLLKNLDTAPLGKSAMVAELYADLVRLSV